MQEKIRTIHVYFEEEEFPTIDADPTPEPEQDKHSTHGLWWGLFLSVLCLCVLLLAPLLPARYETTYDTTITKTLTITLSQHPTTTQVQLVALPPIRKTEQLTVSASASIHQNATFATGLITFYNGLFMPQTVPAGTKLTGKDGIIVITGKTASIPAATPTTPPTYGTVSVTATSAASGSIGNIAASDINHACCGSSILAQNLYPFSGGQDEQDIPVLTKTDIATGTQILTTQVQSAVNDQSQRETKPGDMLLPLQCSQTLTANHKPGDQVSTALLTFTETCIPLAYVTGSIAIISQRIFMLPRGYHLVSFTALVLSSTTTPTGGTLTIRAIAYLKQNIPPVTMHYSGAK